MPINGSPPVGQMGANIKLIEVDQIVKHIRQQQDQYQTQQAMIQQQHYLLQQVQAEQQEQLKSMQKQKDVTVVQ